MERGQTCGAPTKAPTHCVGGQTLQHGHEARAQETVEHLPARVRNIHAPASVHGHIARLLWHWGQTPTAPSE
eukprot:5602445-Alexandrium_andersonii.AAC.1